MRQLLVLLVAVFFLIGCDKISFPTVKKQSGAPQAAAIKGVLLAQVNNWSIGTDDFKERLNALKTLYPQAGDLDSVAKKKILQELINLEILSQVAKEEGLDREEDVISAVNDFKSSLLAQKLREKLIRDLTVTDVEVENFYKSNQLIFREPEERKISEIVVSSEIEAKDILIRLLQGEGFVYLARNYSIAESKDKSGDLGYLAPDPAKKFQKFWEVAFTTEKGKNSSYFKGPDGYYIITVADVRGGKVKQIDEVREDIKTYLKNEKIGKKIEDEVYNAKQRYKVTINEYLID